MLDLDLLLSASSPGGSSCLTSTTELVPAAGPHASVAPAKFASRQGNGNMGTYAYEKRYLDGEEAHAVLIDSKQSQLNRVEDALRQAIADGHPVLSRLPRIVLAYERDGLTEEYTDLDFPHRIFDGHVRAGWVDGTPVTQLGQYRDIRNANPANARALLDASPTSLVFGAWDSSRSTKQGRWRSVLVGEIVGFCHDRTPSFKGGARTDPVGMRIELTSKALKELAERQRDELSPKTFGKVTKVAAAAAKSGQPVAASELGLGGIPPNLETVGGVACRRIIRSHVLSFAALRQLRFGAGPDGDAACRALLTALALNGLARSDAELNLRANCDLREAAPTEVRLDQRGGEEQSLPPLTIASADELLAAALAHAESTAGVAWNGPVLRITGDPAIVAGAVDEEAESGGS